GVAAPTEGFCVVTTPVIKKAECQKIPGVIGRAVLQVAVSARKGPGSDRRERRKAGQHPFLRGPEQSYLDDALGDDLVVRVFETRNGPVTEAFVAGNIAQFGKQGAAGQVVERGLGPIIALIDFQERAKAFPG